MVERPSTDQGVWNRFRYVKLTFANAPPVIVEDFEVSDMLKESEEPLVSQEDVYLTAEEFEALPEWNP